MKKVLTIILLLILVFFVFYTKFDLDRNKINFKKVDINIKETDTNKAAVSNGKELIDALENKRIKIIEITNDIDLGYNIAKEQNIKSEYLEAHNNPLTHPVLKNTGVSKLNIKNKKCLVIYSKKGYRLLHTNIRILDSENIKLENLKMEELWEWDEKTKANYTRNDWDYITIQNSKNIQIKNCEFSKCYDGITDIKNSKNVTIEYSKVNEMDLNDGFYNKQFDELERHIDKYPMYKYLRKEVNLSKEKIKELSAYQFKLYLIGPKDYGAKNENIVIHDSIYENVKTRIPLARNSSVYLYNIYFDASKISYKIVGRQKEQIIKKKYKKIVSLNPSAPISIQRSYVLVENSVFKGVKNSYRWYRGFSYRNLGKIVVNNDKTKTNNLRKKLNRKVGTYEKCRYNKGGEHK